jgi:ATPase family associated with various cellular activities (AAA)
MELLSSLPRQVWSYLSDHSYAAAAVGAVVVVGAAAIAVQNRQLAAEATRKAAEEALRKQNEFLNSFEYRATKLFEELKIKEWYLPFKDGTTSIGTMTSKAPTPVFSEATAEDINKVKEMVKKSLNPDSTAPLPNLIFKGPAGVGKTTEAEDLFRDTKVGFIRIPSGTMENHIKRSTHITTLHEIISLAEKCLRPVYILMDDGEELVAKRPTEAPKEAASTTKAYWLVEQEKIADVIAQRRIALVNAILEEAGKDTRNVGFIVTTNRPDVIDPAFLTRSRVVAIDRPGIEERKHIIIRHLPKVFNNDLNYLDFFKKGRLEDMALKTEGFTGRNIVKMLEDVYACVQLEKGDITQEIVDASIFSMRNSLEKTQPARSPAPVVSIPAPVQPVAVPAAVAVNE